MVFSLAPSVFAAEVGQIFTVTFDNKIPYAGDTITATIYMVQAPTDYYKVTSYIEYNKDILTYVSHTCSWEGMTCAVTEERSGDYRSYVDFKIDSKKGTETDILDKIQTRQTGAIATVTFKVNESCEVGQAINYKIRGSFYKVNGRSAINNQDVEEQLAVTEPGGSVITVPKTPTGYSVSMGADQTVAAGQKVLIPVTVNSSRATVTGFNAYDMTFTYDPAALTLNTASDAAANLTVEDNNGTVRVRRYGETAPLGEALTLDFTAKKGTSSTVTLTAAKFDLDANSINFDAPAATIADADTTVTGLWNVTLPEGFRSAGGVDTVENGGDFTFTAPDAHYDYTLNVTTNGKTEEVIMKGNKSYTIENVTDNVTVTEKSRTAKTYTLKFVVDDRSTGTLGTTPLTLADLGITDETVEVQYPNNYEFTVKFPGTGRYFGATISPDKNRFVKPLGDVSENGDCTYTLDGSKLTGDENGEITITINVYAWRNQITIGVGGNGAEDFDNGNELTCYPTENYTFTVNKSEYYDYTVTATYWAKKLSGNWDTVSLTVRDNGDGTYTIVRMPEIIERYELANVDVTITITKTAKAVDPDAVAAYEYVQLDGKTVVLVTVTGRPGSGKVFTYDGNAMFKANNYGWDLYSWLLILDKGEALDVDALKADVISKLALDDGTATTISQVYDVNKSGVVDINDAQLVYDIYNGTYPDFSKVSMEKFLLADVNCDKMVNSADAVVIVGQFR